MTLSPKSKDQTIQTFMGICAGISKNREMAMTRMDLILRTLLQMDIDNRFHVVARSIDAPFYIPYGNEHVILGLAHYHPRFVQRFREVVKPFIRESYLDRVYELVRMDFNLFASALVRVPCTSPSTKRMENLIFGEEGHPEAGRIVWTFCSIWFNEGLDTFRAVWNLSPEILRKLWIMAKEGKTMTLLESTRPFGSKAG